MARVRSDQPLVPSVLDRLLDDEPEISREPAKGRNQLLRDLKQSVRRDLQNLLNTRCSVMAVPAGLTELKTSLVNYGIPDFTGNSRVTSADREAFCRMLETIIRQYEPRFHTIKVVLLTDVEPLDRTLRFRIDALLRCDPAPEPVVFDSTLEPATGAFAVSGGAG